jgi:hypothetical protein
MAKIVSITPTGQWQEFHKMDVTFDDGQAGTAFSKSPTPWYAVGDEVEYSINAKGSVKISKGTGAFAGGGSSYSGSSQSSGSSSKDQQIARSVVFKGAVDLACAGKIQITDIPGFVDKYLSCVLDAPAQGASYAQHFPEQSPF